MVAVVVAWVVVPGVGRGPPANGSCRDRMGMATIGSGPGRRGRTRRGDGEGRGLAGRTIAALVPIAAVRPSPRPPLRAGPRPSMGRTIRADSGPGGCPSAGRSADRRRSDGRRSDGRRSDGRRRTREGRSRRSSRPRPRSRAPPWPRRRGLASTIPASAGRLGAAGIVVLAPSAASAAAPYRSRAAVGASRGRVVPAAVASVVLVLVAPPVAAEAVVAFVAFAPAAAPSPPDASPRSDAPPARVGGEVAGQASRDDGDPRGTRVRGEEPGGPEDERPREGLHDDRAEGMTSANGFWHC